VDASSSQSRADVLGIVMSAVLLLTGLQWLSLKARPVEAVAQDGVALAWVDPKARLPEAAAKEMEWCARGAGQGGAGAAGARSRRRRAARGRGAAASGT
jgi:hypothetical protein